MMAFSAFNLSLLNRHKRCPSSTLNRHSMNAQKIIILLLILLLGQTGFSQDKKTKLAELMKAYHNYNMFDGAVLVAENGEVVYKGAFGLANREWNIPNCCKHNGCRA